MTLDCARTMRRNYKYTSPVQNSTVPSSLFKHYCRFTCKAKYWKRVMLIPYFRKDFLYRVFILPLRLMLHLSIAYFKQRAKSITDTYYHKQFAKHLNYEALKENVLTSSTPLSFFIWVSKISTRYLSYFYNPDITVLV